jgi:hypothetical protein
VLHLNFGGQQDMGDVLSKQKRDENDGEMEWEGSELNVRVDEDSALAKLMGLSRAD